MMACSLSTLIWPHGSAPASLASLLFDPATHKSLEKRSVSRLSYLFAHLYVSSFFWLSLLIFSSLIFSSPALPISAFYLSIYCRKFGFQPCFDNFHMNPTGLKKQILELVSRSDARGLHGSLNRSLQPCAFVFEVRMGASGMGLKSRPLKRPSQSRQWQSSFSFLEP